MRKSPLALLTLTTVLLATGCSGEKGSSSSGSTTSGNLVQNTSRNVDRLIEDDGVTFGVVSPDVLRARLANGTLLATNAQAARSLLNRLPRTAAPASGVTPLSTVRPSFTKSNATNPLILGFPIGLIGEQSVFGGVITKVSDRTNDSLGMLKLTDLTPLHVRPLVSAEGDAFALTLVGCPGQCDETARQVPLINLPIVGVSAEGGMVMVDLSAIGDELDLISMMDPQGRATGLKAISSATTAFDFSVSTLVFDIKTRMIPKDASPSDASAPVTEFTVRWYMKLASAFNPAFTARAPTPGVGFFQTERGKDAKITRFSTTNYFNTVKYYVKNVPAQWQPAFSRALDAWNVEFRQLLGRDLLSYEFVGSDDPRHAELVPGDIRYNIIEWDLDNLAPYGGLGPSIAHQFTGETLSANVLIQGPKIIELYSKWFRLSGQVVELRERGLNEEAERLVREFSREAERLQSPATRGTYRVKLGDALELTVNAAREDLEDPAVKNDFEVVPAGMSFETYMNGYFREMLAHEIGHNLGLRHNFKGNLGASDNRTDGSVSRSIMEYMGRGYRFLNTIGLYDRMAIAYGYTGAAPGHLDWFCTDEHQASNAANARTLSAECTKSDATNDPFSFWEGRLARAIDLLVAPGTTEAPVWTLAELNGQTDEATMGMLLYSANNAATAATWVGFFGRNNRPERPADVANYVYGRIQRQLCNPALATAIAAKATPEARELAQANLRGLARKFTERATFLNLPEAAARLACPAASLALAE